MASADQDTFQATLDFRAPQLLLFLHSLVQHAMLQLVLYSRSYLNQFVSVKLQLAMIAYLCGRNPDLGESSLE